MSTDLFDATGDDELVLRLHVVPGAGRTVVAGRHGGALKVRVAAPPEGGRANDACLALVADVFGVAKGDVTLTSGPASRTKRVRVTGVTAEEADRRLAAALAEAGERPGRKPTGRESSGPRIR